jgi:hypothetical protein
MLGHLLGGGPVEHDTHGSVLIVLDQQHDRSVEVGVEEQRCRHQELPAV